LDAELLCVLGVQSLPAVELHGLGADDASNGLAGEKPLQHVEADVPAGRAHRHEPTIDLVPELEARAVAQRLQLPSDVAAPAVLEEAGLLGSRHARLRDLRRTYRREPGCPDVSRAPIGIEGPPLRQALR